MLTPLLLCSLKTHKFWALTLLGIALLEYRQISIGFAEPDPVTGEGGMREDYVPGDLGFDPLGLAPQDEGGLNMMKTKELNNGRLAVSLREKPLSCLLTFFRALSLVLSSCVSRVRV